MPDIATIQTSIDQAVVNVTEVDEVQIVEVSVSSDPVVIETGIVGPQGPQGDHGSAGYRNFRDLEDVNAINRVDRSVVVYDSGTGKFTVNAIHTIDTLTDGGNF